MIWDCEATGWRRLCSYLEHLLDFLPRQVDVELVEELQDLADAQAAVAVLIGFGERLFEPPDEPAVKKKKARRRGAAETRERRG